MNYIPSPTRYDSMPYLPAGDSGLKLPLVSLGLWHNFGTESSEETRKSLCFTAFDHGITHFDLANNYGPVPGSAEENFGRILHQDMSAHRDEMLISTKAGYTMWDGPYGDWGSRKYLISSLNQSLKRMNLDYVDIFYHHRMDKNTPLEETMLALTDIVRSGKALYVGLSNYDGDTMLRASAILKDLHCPFVINQNRYSIFDRSIEQNGLKSAATLDKKGIIAFSPLAQGLLSDKYIKGIPADSRMSGSSIFLNKDALTPEKREKIITLNALAQQRGETLAQMALAFVLKDPCVCSVLVGASKPQQIIENIAVLNSPPITDLELKEIDRICNN